MGPGRTRGAVGIQPGSIDQDGFRDVKKGFMDGDEVRLTSFSRKFTNRAELLRVGEREVGNASTISHRAVCRVRALILYDGEVYLVHDRVGRGWATLLDEVNWNGRIDERRSRYLIIQLLTGLEHYHSKGTAHWDIQPRNIAIGNSDELRVLNIGTGAIKLKATTGVLQYVPSQLSCRAPELFNGVTSLSIKEGIHADVWSCGVVLYFMLCGKLPFEDDRVCELKHKIDAAEGMYFPPWVSESAQGFVRKLLRTNPKSRPSTKKALREPWIRENDEKSVRATIRGHISVLQETKLSIKALSLKQKGQATEVKRNVHAKERSEEDIRNSQAHKFHANPIFKTH
mmetsp:Transcript_24653/g.35520  ORF Transcript_24653/g.35520 Transcript_24653/m.35520 type:complete len:342 (-) Transcript_24653:477-1502(-)|eukprot:CAMPEP_0184743374 /NCGR_PEP_ID=MMETSP0315-20130426/6243_1 /TAXON_ID=101924 /ORGANISM="Rhodosorus marinus, Strain UTEX LB 2760" /LENGTH=341 /DNA_ID=CAMNT_0027214601 /DNA_START=400 /DNA_END=1425 /DNA_ORIENTATION=+